MSCVFDPATIQDHATFEKPQQLATGVRDVFVNGVQVLNNGKHTGASAGQVVRGPAGRAGRAEGRTSGECRKSGIPRAERKRDSGTFRHRRLLLLKR